MNANIRRATAADLDEWLRMRHDLWSEVEPEDLLDEMKGILTDDMRPVFVLERVA